MERSDERIEILTKTVIDQVWQSGDFREFDRGRLLIEIRDGVETGLKKMDEESLPLYFFNFTRTARFEGDGDGFSSNESLGGRSYLKVIAENEPAAVKEATKISGDPGECEGRKVEWIFFTESVTPVLPQHVNF